MELKSVWVSGMFFETRARNRLIGLDASPPLGKDRGPSPREAVIAALAAGTGMDIIGLLKKYKQLIHKFEIKTHAETGHEYPIVFTKIKLSYEIEGEVEERFALEAIRLSHTRYSGICAMISKSVKINWRLILNGKGIYSGTVNEYLSHE